MVPGGNPVTAVPGLTPSSPVMALAVALVTVEPARTAKFAAEPSDGACADAGEDTHGNRTESSRPRTPLVWMLSGFGSILVMER